MEITKESGKTVKVLLYRNLPQISDTSFVCLTVIGNLKPIPYPMYKLQPFSILQTPEGMAMRHL